MTTRQMKILDIMVDRDRKWWMVWQITINKIKDNIRIRSTENEMRLEEIVDIIATESQN